MKQLPNNKQATHKGKLEIVTPHEVPHEQVFKEKMYHKRWTLSCDAETPFLKRLAFQECHVNPVFHLNAKPHFPLKNY